MTIHYLPEIFMEKKKTKKNKSGQKIMKCSINIANVYQIGVIRKKDNLY